MGIILVVEDEPGVAETLKAILEDEGYTVILAANGRDALEWLVEHRPSLVISDLMMPLMSGQALYRAMQADEGLRDVPFLAMSALDGSMAVQQLPGVVFVPKPFSITEMLSTVDRLLADTGLDRPQAW